MLKRLSESELDVMLVVWRAQEALDTGEVARRLQKGWKIQAVQVVLGRLVKKGYLSCEKIGRLNYYTPLVAEADYRAAETETFVEKLYRNSPKSLIAALVRRVPGLTSAAYRHRIVVCTGPRCSAKGGTALLRAVENALGIAPGETTPDGCFRLETRNCLKQCGSAPNLTVDQTLYASVRVEDIPNLLKRYREPSC